jgi:hypothetical protein
MESSSWGMQTRCWRLEHLDTYQQALPWLAACANIIDTTSRSPAQAARESLSGSDHYLPSWGRAGAADHPGSAVSSGQPGTTTPQVNPPVGWWRDRSDLAYNDEVTGSSPVTPTPQPGDPG